MTIENRDLKPGTKLVARYKGRDYSAEVVETEAGIRYRFEDGREFKSPSAAGSAIMGGSACNGWAFWSLAADGPSQPKSAPGLTFRGQNAALKAKMKGFRRLEDGRFFCSVCMDAFDAPKGVAPIGCPKGHPAEEQAAA